MALVDEAGYYSDAQNLVALTSPSIGPVGVSTASFSFLSAKFDNGGLATASNSRILYNSSTITPDLNKFMYGTWFKFLTSKAAFPSSQFFFNSRISGSHGYTMAINTFGNIQLYKQDAGGTVLLIDYAGASWSAGDLVKITYVIDNSASFDGAKTAAIYWNDVQIASTTTAFNITTGTQLELFSGFGGNAFQSVIMDDIKIIKDVSASLLSDFITNQDSEGFPTPTYTIPMRTKTLPEYTEKIVLDNDPDFDLVKLGLVKQFPSFKYKKTFDRRLAITNELNIPIINISDYLSLDNPKSVFNGVDWKGMNIKLTDKFGIDVWEGYIEEISRNHRDKSGVLKCKSKFYRYRELFVDYTSGVGVNPITAFNSIISQYEVPGINTRSADISEAYLSGNVTIKVTSTLEKQKKLIEVLEEIAKYSSASLYFYNGEIYVQVWQPNENLAVDIAIEESDLNLEPIVETPDRMLINDYVYGYDGDGGIPTRDSDNDDIGALSREKFISRPSEIGQSDFIAFENATSAQFVGEQNIRSTNRDLDTDPKPLTKIGFSVNLTEYRRFIELSSFIKLTFSDEAWDEKIFEVFEMDLNYEKDTLGIVAYENVV